MKLVLFIFLGAVIGAAIGAVVNLVTNVGTIATVFFGVAGSYVGMIFADNRFGPRSRKCRMKRAEEARRQLARQEAENRRVAAAAARPSAGRAARKATARAKR